MLSASAVVGVLACTLLKPELAGSPGGHPAYTGVRDLLWQLVGPTRSEHLIVEDQAGSADEPLPLGISVTSVVHGGFITVSGLPAGAELSLGALQSPGVWLLSVGNLDQSFIGPPKDFIGTIEATVTLRSENDQALDTKAMRFSWRKPERTDAPLAPEALTRDVPHTAAPLVPNFEADQETSPSQPQDGSVISSKSDLPSGSTPSAAPAAASTGHHGSALPAALAPLAAPAPNSSQETPPLPAQDATTMMPPSKSDSHSATTPSAAHTPPGPPPEEISAWIRVADELLRHGEISAARILLQRAANAHSAEASLRLGMTFDPTVLHTWGVVGIAANADRAKDWYTRAAQLGSSEAARRLQQGARDR